jgi:hypothetical protein
MDGADGQRFQRQASCSCAPSMSRRYVRGGFDLDDDDDYYFDGQFDKAASYGRAPAGPSVSASSRGCGTKLRGLWRKIVREKKRILLCTTGCVPMGPSASREPYDAYSYAQNFDDGAAWVEEPENLSRSFSARFAVPSRVLQRVAV